MTALRERERSKRSLRLWRRKAYRGYFAIWQRRRSSLRFYVVRNALRRAELVVSPDHEVRQGNRFGFVLMENGIFTLPSLGYKGLHEVTRILNRVVAESMADMKRMIRDAIREEFALRAASKQDLQRVEEKIDRVAANQIELTVLIRNKVADTPAPSAAASK